MLAAALALSLTVNGAGCEPALTLAFVGDVILHRSLQRQVKREGYGPLLDEVRPLLEGADFTVANLEGPIAPGVSRTGQRTRRPDGRGFPRFNFPVSLAHALKDVGVDAVQTANNHTLDRGSLGVDETLRHVEAAGLVPFGTRKKSARGGRHRVVEVKGKKIALFSCTFWVNGKEDARYQVQFCHRAGKRRLLRDIQRVRGDVDLVVVMVHWGIEDAEKPGGSQVRFAKALIDAGADAVIGGHPHVLHRVRHTRGKKRAGVVAYSLGNFVSAQQSLPHREGAVLYLDAVEGDDGLRFLRPRLRRTRLTRPPVRARPLEGEGAKGSELIVDNFPNICEETHSPAKEARR